ISFAFQARANVNCSLFLLCHRPLIMQQYARQLYIGRVDQLIFLLLLRAQFLAPLLTCLLISSSLADCVIVESSGSCSSTQANVALCTTAGACGNTCSEANPRIPISVSMTGYNICYEYADVTAETFVVSNGILGRVRVRGIDTGIVFE